MATHKVLGVVSRAADYRDHDRILTLITREQGRLTATARGCRKPQSKLLTAGSPFCYGEYVLNEVDGRFYVSQCEVREVFYDIRLRPEALTAAAFATAVCEEFANPGEPFTKPFSLLLSTLMNLTNQALSPRGSITFFLGKLLCFEGYELEMNNCILCGSQTALHRVVLGMGGTVCDQCLAEAEETAPIADADRRLLAMLGDVPSAAYEKVAQAMEQQTTILPILDWYVRELVARRLPSLDQI